MEPMNSRQLLEQLEADTRQLILQTHHLLQEDPGVLLQQPGERKWSVAQVIEHLNAYGRYYLPAIENRLSKARYAANPVFKPGWLGNYFTNMMLPKEGRIANKMKAFKNYTPTPDVDSKTVLDEFLAQQQTLLQLLERAKQTDTGRIRIPVSISPVIKIKLGDTFRFIIAHQQRHFLQVKNTLEAVKAGLADFAAVKPAL